MSIANGARVTAEVFVSGKPEKISGTVTDERGGVYEIRPDGFETLTIDVPARHVYEAKPDKIVRPKLDYQKK